MSTPVDRLLAANQADFRRFGSRSFAAELHRDRVNIVCQSVIESIRTRV
jgi:hypothetical protein